MAGQIRLSPEGIRVQARVYGQAAQEVESIVSRLTRVQEELRNEWEGSAFQGFDAQFQELKPKVIQFSNLLQSIQLQLEKTATTMQECDQALSRNFGLH